LLHKGRLLKDAKNTFLTRVSSHIQDTFVPIPSEVNRPKIRSTGTGPDVDQDGPDVLHRREDRHGLPPGKYRVAVEPDEKKKDLLGGT